MITFSDNIKVVEGDLLETEARAICQISNCFRTMGSGIARSIKAKWPEVARVDSMTPYADPEKLGTYSIAKVKNRGQDFYIFSIYGQYTYGTEKRQLNYEAIYNGLDAVKNYLLKNNILSLGIPYLMGCGLAGGSWTVVSAMIEDIFGETPIKVTITKLPEKS